MENIHKIVFWKCSPRTHLIGLFLTNRICHIFIAPTFLFRMVKTAPLYLVPIKSYSIYNQVHSILKRIVVVTQMVFLKFWENNFKHKKNFISPQVLLFLQLYHNWFLHQVLFVQYLIMLGNVMVFLLLIFFPLFHNYVVFSSSFYLQVLTQQNSKRLKLTKHYSMLKKQSE